MSIQKLLFCLFFIVFSTSFSFAQNLSQTVRGKVLDADNQLPLIGAVVSIVGSAPLIGTATDLNGKFRLEEVPVGRINLKVSYLGYEAVQLPNIVVTSGKEVVLEISMQESIVKMDEVVISATEKKGESLNEMAMISSRSISSEETSRYAGGFNDPSRILANFAGVTSTQDGSNDIIVRGNSPKYVQWRLEGIQITNPNHFADQSAVGGAVSTLNNNILGTSDFHTGAFTAEFGDVLSGVYDVKLRTGNNEKFESVFGFGLLGTDITLEGPLKEGYGGSYLVNYRYSTATIISELGLIDGVSGVPKFQDAAFKIVLPTEKWGVFSLFGLSGLSSLDLEDVTPALWETPGNRSMIEEITEDFNKDAYLLNTGLNHTYSINEKSYFRTTLSLSTEGVEDKVFENRSIRITDSNGNFLKDSTLNRIVNFNSKLKKSTYRGALTYNTKLNARHKIQLGTKYALFNYTYKQSQFLIDPSDRSTLTDFNENVSTIRNFVSWKYRMSEAFTIVAGIQNMNVLLNSKSTIEPRLALDVKLNPSNSIHFGYGKHSTMESIHNYFAKVTRADGAVVEPNKDLGLLKANHYVVGYEKRLSENMRANLEIYYQDLYNLPVENLDTSHYATINEGLEFRYVDLVNKGSGKNYGIELTVERFFAKNYYYLINGSIYNSTYKALDGKERNTQYNGSYLLNFLGGKEFTERGKKKNKTLAINVKAFFGGGKKIIPLLRDEQGNAVVDPANNRYWDYDNAYEDKIEDVYQITISGSCKWDKPKATHELFLNLDNVTDNKGKLTEFYDEEEPNNIGYTTQFGFFPNLMYRVYF